MDADDFLPRGGAIDALELLAKQDLDALSVNELERRIALLTAEIDRVKLKLSTAVNHKASAEALFRK